ncbi:MAG: hypothetical protein DYG83_17915 [Candidatus Brocadia sp. AMX2]|uniref:Phosphate starvation-inducible protein PhoH ATPase n=1 Tax=Candidatus Brocadia sinica JPN1 TaxID=1197129 RepID=A0ABQ0K0D1_9BACT|nr:MULTISPECIES: hypothetical protein [Brocadia]KXK32962.1 MAG: hypothetical protein UZ01_00384 [Candidatus Brocadia sinica]MBC6934090.1 hypothetical protein [Candidatus Brocadia sp.]MBL1170729.1 hypothetical protein [Candidatus Brocadia sp. AMX1]NOG42225.1 hypothetical protein [Planctomycetota bacterium]KAA0241339.1 MAG: hypothetical protein EDM70_18400 [Candidatus Brocadia sp. AMX2]
MCREVVEKTGDIPASDGKMEDVRQVVHFLSNTLKSLEKEHVMQAIPELSELGKQFEKAISSWGTVTTSVDSSQ